MKGGDTDVHSHCCTVRIDTPHSAPAAVCSNSVFCNCLDKMVLEQGASESICPQRYDERQTESKWLQGKRSVERTRTGRNKHEGRDGKEHVS